MSIIDKFNSCRDLVNKAQYLGRKCKVGKMNVFELNSEEMMSVLCYLRIPQMLISEFA